MLQFENQIYFYCLILRLVSVKTHCHIVVNVVVLEVNAGYVIFLLLLNVFLVFIFIQFFI
jgi:hypothetical protein